MTKDEILLYELEVLVSYEPDDLDNPEVEVYYEDAHGNEGSINVCVVELATRARKRLSELLGEQAGPSEEHF